MNATLSPASAQSEAPDSPDAIVRCEGLTHRYGRTPVLEDVTFSVEKGESLCVIGPNGGGKSTLLKLLLGLILPEKGRITILGRSPADARDRVGYVPQSIQFDQKFPVSALDVVLMGRLDRIGLWGRFGKGCREAARDALERVGLENHARSPFSQLSGGERQRVLIARALACDPEILLLDEPTANIDLSVEARFLETLDELQKSMTVLLVTHDLDVISRLGDSALCVNRRVHRHSLPLSPELVQEIYSGRYRLEHDRQARHRQGDHSACDHD